MLGYIVCFFPWIGGVWMAFEALFGSFGGHKIQKEIKRKIIIYAVSSFFADLSIIGILGSTVGKFWFRKQIINELQGKKGLITNPLKKGLVKSIIDKTPIGRAINIGTKIAGAVDNTKNNNQQKNTNQDKTTETTRQPINSYAPKKQEENKPSRTKSQNEPDINKIPSKKQSTEKQEVKTAEQRQKEPNKTDKILNKVNIKNYGIKDSKTPEQKQALAKEMSNSNDLMAQKFGKEIMEKLKTKTPKMFDQISQKLKTIPIEIPGAEEPFKIPANKIFTANQSILKQLNKK